MLKFNSTLMLFLVKVLFVIATFFASFNAIAAQTDKQLMVVVEQAQQTELTPTIWLAGDVINRLDTQISSELGGRITWVADVGTAVQQAQIIATIDSRDFALQLAEKQSQIRQQQTQTEYLQKQQERLKSLLLNNSTAKIELEQIKRDLAIAKEQLATLLIQQQQIEINIEKASIRAPFSGIINRRLVQLGEFVSTGTLLLQLVDPNSLDISVSAPLSVAQYLEQGAEVLVKWENRIEKVAVRTWSPAGERLSRTFEVLLDASNLHLLGGHGVSVALPHGTSTQAVMVPRDALIIRQQETFVITVDQDSKTQKVLVDVGRGKADWISVNGDIQTGTSVVIRGGEQLKTGQSVKIVELTGADERSQLAVAR